MLRITGVVKHLLIINVLMYLGTMLLGEPSNALDLINERSTDFSDDNNEKMVRTVSP